MPWSDFFTSRTGVRNMSRRLIQDEVFDPMRVDGEFKILIVDALAMKIISSCFRTEEVMSFNIAVIEELENTTRETVSYMSAVYVLYPSVQNCGCLQSDLVGRRYQSMHLFFLCEMAEELYKKVLGYASPGQVQTFRELDILFHPVESQVFSLCDDGFFAAFFDSFGELDVLRCALVARRLATLCRVLGVRPRVRYRRGFFKNFVIAEALDLELRQGGGPWSCEDCARPRCELVVLDRGFDCVSPLVHEFTLQAMAYDLLDIRDDLYELERPGSSAETRTANQVSLTDGEPLWVKLRHEHIANVGRVIDGSLKTDLVLSKHQSLSRFKKLPALGDVVRRHVVFRRNQPYSVYKCLANECMKLYLGGVNVLADLEQNLATGGDDTGRFTPARAREALGSILANADYEVDDKLRVILLYVFYVKGVSRSEFEDLVARTGLSYEDAGFLCNVLHLDVDFLRPGQCRAVVEDLPQYPRDTVYKQSRWTPAVRNLMMSCVDGSLSADQYPYLDSKERTLGLDDGPSRRGYWCQDKKDDHLSRLIVFVVGGVTHSEMRCAYEIMEKYKGWEVFIGGDTILTPKKFLDKLRSMRCLVVKRSKGNS